MINTEKFVHFESVESLRERVSEPLSKIDLSVDIDPATRDDIEFGGISGTPVSDYAQKLLVLLNRKTISGDDYRRLIVASIGDSD